MDDEKRRMAQAIADMAADTMREFTRFTTTVTGEPTPMLTFVDIERTWRQITAIPYIACDYVPKTHRGEEADEEFECVFLVTMPDGQTTVLLHPDYLPLLEQAAADARRVAVEYEMKVEVLGQGKPHGDWFIIERFEPRKGGK